MTDYEAEITLKVTISFEDTDWSQVMEDMKTKKVSDILDDADRVVVSRIIFDKV